MQQNRPWGEFTSLISTESYQVNMIKMNPNESSKKHYHKLSSERYFIISGQAILLIDNEEIVLSSEDIAEIPKNKYHSIKCISDEPLVFVEIKIGSNFGNEDTYRE